MFHIFIKNLLNSKFKFKVQVQNLNSTFRFKIQVQNLNSKFRFKIKVPHFYKNLNTTFKFEQLEKVVTGHFRMFMVHGLETIKAWG